MFELVRIRSSLMGLAAALVIFAPLVARADEPKALVSAPALASAWNFAHAPAIGGLSSRVAISPDGKHIAAITSPDGKASVISVWETEHLDKAPSI